MANIELAVANRVHVVSSFEQVTLTAGEGITAGMAVRVDTSTGKATKANGTTAGESRVIGIAVRTVVAGEGVTVLRRGLMDGFTFTQDYDASIYLSDTDGRLADAPGSEEVVIGRVFPGQATTLGTAADKLLLVELPGASIEEVS
jgi:hypothetical protein